MKLSLLSALCTASLVGQAHAQGLLPTGAAGAPGGDLDDACPRVHARDEDDAMRVGISHCRAELEGPGERLPLPWFDHDQRMVAGRVRLAVKSTDKSISPRW